MVTDKEGRRNHSHTISFQLLDAGVSGNGATFWNLKRKELVHAIENDPRSFSVDDFIAGIS